MPGNQAESCGTARDRLAAAVQAPPVYADLPLVTDSRDTGDVAVRLGQV